MAKIGEVERPVPVQPVKPGNQRTQRRPPEPRPESELESGEEPGAGEADNGHVDEYA